MEDFCWFLPPKVGGEATAGPPAEAGAAMLALCEGQQVQIPGFAMAFYDALATAGEGITPPTPLALLADDALLLAPVEHQEGWRGLLLAEDTAAGQVRAFRMAGDPQRVVSLLVPDAPDAVTPAWAAAGAWLPIVQSADSTPQPPALPPGLTGNSPATNGDHPTTPEPDTGDGCCEGSG
jgi:hypothetical protein